jgi:hypothetical protein
MDLRFETRPYRTIYIPEFEIASYLFVFAKEIEWWLDAGVRRYGKKIVG